MLVQISRCRRYIKKYKTTIELSNNKCYYCTRKLSKSRVELIRWIRIAKIENKLNHLNRSNRLNRVNRPANRVNKANR